MILIQIPSLIGPEKLYEIIEDKFWIFPGKEKIESHGWHVPNKHIILAYKDSTSLKVVKELTSNWFSWVGSIFQDPYPFDYISLHPYIFNEAVENKIGGSIEEIVYERGATDTENPFFYQLENGLIQFEIFQNSNKINIIKYFNKFINLDDQNSIKNKLKYLSAIINLNVRIAPFYDNIYYELTNFFILSESIINEQVRDFKITKKCRFCSNEFEVSSSFKDKVEYLFNSDLLDDNKRQLFIKAFKLLHSSRSSFVHFKKYETMIDAANKEIDRIGKSVTLSDQINSKTINTSARMFLKNYCQEYLFNRLLSLK